MRPTRLQIAKRDIVTLFDQSERTIYWPSDIAVVLQKNRSFWRLAQDTRAADFIDFLCTASKLRRIELKSEQYGTLTRYVWGEASPYALALSVARDAYLSHGTAVFLHGLTQQLPRTIYVNREQSPKPSPAGTLTQDRLDQAFTRKQRASQLVYTLDDYRVVVLAGKNSKRLGVTSLAGPAAAPLEVTNVERTLVDIVVRPGYAGGVLHVLEAYQAARDRVSLNRLIATLRKLDYVYPYHQAMGYFMERSGYPPPWLDRFRAMGLSYDFYLEHGTPKDRYDRSWRVYVPLGL